MSGVRVNNGKYEFIKDGLKIKILRHGEEWHEQSDAFNALTSIMYELDAARVVLKACREASIKGALPVSVENALRKHAGARR